MAIDKEINVRLAIQPDDAANAKVEASISKIETRLTSLTSKANTEFPKAARSTELFLQGLNKAADAAKNYEENIAGAVDETEKLGKAQGGVGGGGGSFGLEGLRRTGGALSQLGLGAVGDPIRQLGDIGQVTKELGQVGTAIEELGISSAAAGVAILPVVAIVGGVALAFKALSDSGQKGKDDADKAIVALDAYYATIEKGTQTTVKQQLKDLEDAKTINDAKLEDAKRSYNDSQKKSDITNDPNSPLAIFNAIGEGLDDAFGGGKEWAAKVKELAKASDDYQAKIDGLKKAMGDGSLAANTFTDAVLNDAKSKKKQVADAQADAALTTQGAQAKLKAQKDLVAQDEAELQVLLKSGDTSEATTKRIADLQTELSGLNHEIFTLENTTIPDAQAVDDLNQKLKDNDKAMVDRGIEMDKAAAAEEAKNKSIADAVQKYNTDVEKITDAGLQERISIEKKYQDTLLSIATKAAQDAVDDLRKLKDQQAQNLIALNRNEQDANARARFDDMQIQVKAQEEEAQSLVEHQRKLQDIRQNARNQEADFILNRNFLGLFQNQLATRQAMEGENTSFGRSEQDKSVARQQQSRDASAQREFEHQQRLQDYARANQDAKRSYDIQIRDQQIASQRARQVALQGEQQQLIDTRNKVTAELSLRRQGIVAELQLINMGEQQKLALQKSYLSQAQSLLNSTLNTQRATQAATINYTQHISTPNADPRQVAAIANNQFIQNLRRVTGAGV